MAILGFTLTSSYDYLVFKEQKLKVIFTTVKKLKWSLAGSNR